MSSRLAVCLLSGGLDSSTCLALARRDDYECYALSFDYGQRHRVELDAAARVAASFGAREHRTARIDLRAFGGSALTAEIDVPKHRSPTEMEHGIPITYVPARNTIFLSYALAWAEVLEASDIFIGVNALDYSGYPDCRPEFIHAFEHMANLATKAGVEGRTHIQIHAPLIELRKADIVRLAAEHHVLAFGLPGRIRRIAPGAAQIAPAGANEHAGHSRQHPLALNRIKHFSNFHDAYTSGSGIPASANPFLRSRQESHWPHARPSASGS